MPEAHGQSVSPYHDITYRVIYDHKRGQYVASVPYWEGASVAGDTELQALAGLIKLLDGAGVQHQS